MKKILSILSLLIILSTFAIADGGFFPPMVYYDEDIHEPTQKAAIVFDGNLEQLIIQVTYEGELTNFAWVIPVPNYPDINESNSRLFEELHFLTQPNYRTPPNLFFGRVMMAGMDKQMEGVNVLEQKQVGIYEVTVLSSTNPNALVNWLNENNYKVSEKAESVLNFYIQKEWYFIAMRINLAPFDETILESLREVNENIQTSDDAVTLITNELVNNIKSEKEYDKLTTITSVELNYGEEEEIDDYMRRMQGTNKPETIITEHEYTEHYEAYNGYFDNHMHDVVKKDFTDKLMQEIAVPKSYECYNNIADTYEDRCYVWYFTKESEEYKLLEDSKCGKYCLKDKEKYTMDELADAAANAVVENDEEIENYFGTNAEKRNWYDNKEDEFKYVRGTIRARLNKVLVMQGDNLGRELEDELLEEYSQKLGIEFNYIYELAEYVASSSLENLKDGASFSDSKIYNKGIMDWSKYRNYEELYKGTHSEPQLRQKIEPIVENVVYWKTQTTQEKLNDGTIQPVSIEFETTEIIYPLKISSINKGVTEILLYVFAKYRTDIDGFKTEYAKWIETEDIKTPQYMDYMERISSSKEIMPRYWYPSVYYHLNQLLDDRYFLTKFRKEMWPKEMTDDLVIVQAENNKEYKMTILADGYFIGWIFAIIGLVFITAFIYGLFIGPRFLNNKFIKEDSPFHITWKRLIIYAAAVPAFVIVIALLPYQVSNAVGDISRFIGEIFEFIFQIFNFIGIPKFINGVILFILGLFLVFYTIHMIISLIIKAIRKKTTS